MFSFLRREPGFYRRAAALAFPIMLQNLITHAMGLLDTFMVGLLGELPLAAVTLANIPCFVILFVGFGIQSGCSVLISQFWGKKDTETVNRIMGMGLYASGSVTLIFSLVMFFLPHPFLSLFGNDPQIIELAVEYARIIGFSFFADSFVQTYVSAHRATENPRLGMYILGVTVVCNTFLNWVLIFGKLGAPAMGVAGAALATLISRVLGAVIVVLHALSRRGLPLRLSLLLSPGREVAARFFRYATPVVLNETAWGLGTSLYTTVMAHMEGSKEILAAYAIAGNIDRVCTVAVFAVAASSAVIIGREIGAGRDRKTVYDVGACLGFLSAALGVALTAVLMAALYLVIIPFLYPLFELSAQAARISTGMLAIVFLTLALRSFNVTGIVGILRGGGDVRAATIIDTVPLWFVALPLTAVAGLILKWDILLVYLVMTVENLVKAVWGYRRFRSGVWIRNLTVDPQVKEE